MELRVYGKVMQESSESRVPEEESRGSTLETCGGSPLGIQWSPDK